MKKLFTLFAALFAFVGMASAQDTYIVTGDYNGWSLENNCITFTEQDGGYVATADEFTTGQWGFKIVKNPATDAWGHAFGISDPIATNSDAQYTLTDGGDNIYIGSKNNNITLHNVKFEFYPSSDGSLDYFAITADETVTVDVTPKDHDDYMMVGTWQGWSFENNPLVFEYQGDGVYTASIDQIYGDWKIVKNNSWTDALGGGGMNMQPGNTYNLTKGGDNTGFATGMVLKNGKFTLTILEDGNATIKVEGSMGEEHSYGLVGSFQGWSTTSATFLEQQADGSWTTDVTDFPGGQGFKVSIDKTWTCFCPTGADYQMTFGEPVICERADGKNYTIGEEGTNYNVHVKLVVAADAQSAELTVTDTTSGITLLKTNVNTEDIYTVAGQKVSAPVKGINIVNGKKILK